MPPSAPAHRSDPLAAINFGVQEAIDNIEVTAKTPVLLLLDEIQRLAIVKDGEGIVSALRSAITKSKGAVRVIFTGSNQDRLREQFGRSLAALYEGARM